MTDMSWFDPAICYYCYRDHGPEFHDKAGENDLFGKVRDCPECGTVTTEPHSDACSRSGIMLGERYH